MRLQEVIGHPLLDQRLTSSRRGVELQKGVFQMLVHFHNCRLISAAITVIWCTEYRHNVLVMAPIVPLHHQLMCPRNQRQSVGVIELFR